MSLQTSLKNLYTVGQVESMDSIIEEELVRDGESDTIQSIDIVGAFWMSLEN